MYFMAIWYMYFMAIWYILCPIGIFYDHLVNLMVILYISPFWLLCHEKSGNTGYDFHLIILLTSHFAKTNTCLHVHMHACMYI
jgi:hypothetical protein